MRPHEITETTGVWAMSYQIYFCNFTHSFFQSLNPNHGADRFLSFPPLLFLYHVEKLRCTVEIVFVFLISNFPLFFFPDREQLD